MGAGGGDRGGVLTLRHGTMYKGPDELLAQPPQPGAEGRAGGLGTAWTCE